MRRAESRCDTRDSILNSASTVRPMDERRPDYGVRLTSWRWCDHEPDVMQPPEAGRETLRDRGDSTARFMTGSPIPR
jgi:hypothetical protein